MFTFHMYFHTLVHKSFFTFLTWIKWKLIKNLNSILILNLFNVILHFHDITSTIRFFIIWKTFYQRDQGVHSKHLLPWTFRFQWTRVSSRPFLGQNIWLKEFFLDFCPNYLKRCPNNSTWNDQINQSCPNLSNKISK